MRPIQCLLLATLLSVPSPAQKPKFHLNADTPEGLMLQQAGQEADDTRKLQLYEEYLAKYAKHEGVAYALSQAQPLWLKVQQFDKVFSAAETILAADAHSPAAAYQALQAAEQKKDLAAVAKWAGRTVEAAKAVISSSKPSDEEEAEEWTRQVEYSRQVATRCEYSLYVAALQTTDAVSIAALYETLEKSNPASQYIGDAGGRYFIALLMQKDETKALAFAERAAEKNLANEDMLLYAADGALRAKEWDKANSYAEKITTQLPEKAAPAGMDAAAWETKKKSSLGRAWWMAGNAQGSKENWAASDKAMRTALPFLENNPDGKALLPSAHFFLGLANFRLARAGAKPNPALTAEAKKFFTACAAVASPYQAQAQKFLAAMAAGK